VTIDRKYTQAWTGRLSTRFIVISNDLPRLTDASGALSSRFIVLRLKQSFYGREDHGLYDKLLTELPAIFNWTLTGYDRLRRRGHLLQPESAREVIQELEDLGSPVSAFIRERCVVEPGRSAVRADVLMVWKAWCVVQGREHPGTVQSFGRDLRAALPGIIGRQPVINGVKTRIYEGIGLL